MKEEVIKVIPICIEKIGEIDPDRLARIGKAMKYALPFSVLGGTIYCIFNERMTNKQYEHEERMFQMEIEHKERMFQIKHEEKMAEIKANLLSRAEERKNEKDN